MVWGWRRERRRIWLTVSLALTACATVPPEPPSAACGGGPCPRSEPLPVAAPPEQVNAFVACRRPAVRKEILLDRASRRLHQTVCGSALWFDGLFGERDVDVALKSRGRLEVSTAYSQFTGSRTRVRFDVRIKLPALEERVSAFVGLDDEDDFVRDRSEGAALRSSRSPTDRDEFLAGLGFVGTTTETLQSDFKVGVRSIRLPKVFVQNRVTYIPYSQEQNRILLRITPFWNNRDGAGVTTNSSFDHILEETFLLRWATAATITEESPGLDWRTAVILYQNLSGSRALAYEVFIRGASDASEALGDYGVRTVFREPFFNGSLFAELVLGYSWPRDDPSLRREGAADFGLSVEMPFGIKPE